MRLALFHSPSAETMYTFYADIIRTFHKYSMQLNGLVANMIIYRTSSSMMLDDPDTIQKTFQGAKSFLQDSCPQFLICDEEWKPQMGLDRMIEILDKMRNIFQTGNIYHRASPESIPFHYSLSEEDLLQYIFKEVKTYTVTPSVYQGLIQA